MPSPGRVPHHRPRYPAPERAGFPAGPVRSAPRSAALVTNPARSECPENRHPRCGPILAGTVPTRPAPEHIDIRRAFQRLRPAALCRSGSRHGQVMSAPRSPQTVSEVQHSSTCIPRRDAESQPPPCALAGLSLIIRNERMPSWHPWAGTASRGIGTCPHRNGLLRTSAAGLAAEWLRSCKRLVERFSVNLHPEIVGGPPSG